MVPGLGQKVTFPKFQKVGEETSLVIMNPLVVITSQNGLKYHMASFLI